MANKYFIWKNPECNGNDHEWVEITGSQFFSLEKNFPKRYFIKVDDGAEHGSDVFIFESTYEEYKEWHKKQEKRRRKRKNQELYKPQTISLDDTIYDTELTYNDVIPDEDIDIERNFIKENESHRLKEIIEKLNEKERLVIDIVIEAYDRGISERMVCP